MQLDDLSDMDAEGSVADVPAVHPATYSFDDWSGVTAQTAPTEDPGHDSLIAASRAYQLEMYEESLKKNIIVAMDTGTGKTRIAILRIQKELERSAPSKIVWFLAPTILLCEQQYRTIVSHLPDVQTIVITSQSGVNTWQSKSVWDDVLQDVRIVVATHEVLLQAMQHGFVHLQSISLIVFDEAHGCVKENSGARIMKEFYQRARVRGQEVPAILGLTASPVQGRKLDGLEKLEQTLQSVCRTPTLQRAELVAYTKLPTTFRHECDMRVDLSAPVPENAARLFQMCAMRQELSFEENMRLFGGAAVHRREYDRTLKFFKDFARRALLVYRELGSWPADYYVHRVIRRCIRISRHKEWLEERRPFLISLLRSVETVAPAKPNDIDTELQDDFLLRLSDKVRKLVAILSGYEARRPTGVVFVRERQMAAVLARVLSLHPSLRQRFRAGHVSGVSRMYQDAFDEALVLDPRRGSQEALRQFREVGEAGEAGVGGDDKGMNLLVATSVIEEGIDVPACNLVVCIDEVPTLKAFIQRRGRARSEQSELHLLLDLDTPDKRRAEWEELEREMKRRYEKGLRELADLDREGDAGGRGLDDEALLPPLEVASTQARLRARDAKLHLSHYCATASKALLADKQPLYVLKRETEANMMHGAIQLPPMIRAMVQLPITVPTALRRAYSIHAWGREEDACADAALQAYKALYMAGLVTDHLLPPKRAVDAEEREVETRPGVTDVQTAYRPWETLAWAWKAIDEGEEAMLMHHDIRVRDDDGVEQFHGEMLLPGDLEALRLPDLDPVRLFWSSQSAKPWTVEIGRGELRSASDSDGEDDTVVLLRAAYGHRWPITSQHRLVRFRCADGRLAAEQLGALDLGTALESDGSLSPTSPLLSADARIARFVRGPDGTPCTLQGYSATKPAAERVRNIYQGFAEDAEDVPYVFVRPLPKQVGFLRDAADGKNAANTGAVDEKSAANTSESAGLPRFHRVLKAAGFRVDKLPMGAVQFGTLIPSLMQVLEVHLVAAELLSGTPLRALPMQDRTLVATALSAPAARLQDNYEVLEFVGDAVLKIMASAHCAAENLQMPEGHLSLLKDQRVANSRLCRASKEFGLDQFVVARQWSLNNWRDLYNEATGEGNKSKTDAQAPRTMSTKTLADVVEALIGASIMDGGMERALQCMRLLLPEEEGWLSLETARDKMFAEARTTTDWQVSAELEELLGYRFQRPALLEEALTHSSKTGLEEGGCMDRLEFLGDAVLDYVILQQLLARGDAQGQPMTHQQMHLLRTTLANEHFLGFAAMEFVVGEKRKPLWAFLRHGIGEAMPAMLAAARERHRAQRESVLEALWCSKAYPWVPLLRLRLEKVFSDMVEALIGAVWVDSGSLEAVAALLDKMGILPYMRRAVAENVRLLHPKEELGRLCGSARLHYHVWRGEEGEAEGREATEEAGGAEKVAEEAWREDDSDSLDEEDEGEQGEATLMPSETRAPFGCRLTLDGECIAEVTGAMSQREVETRAAEAAVEKLRSRR